MLRIEFLGDLFDAVATAVVAAAASPVAIAAATAITIAATPAAAIAAATAAEAAAPVRTSSAAARLLRNSALCERVHHSRALNLHKHAVGAGLGKEAQHHVEQECVVRKYMGYT